MLRLVDLLTDPIITPGKDSGHVHMITGGNGFSIEMGNEDALHATCTNSQIKKDGSNYWVPSLYFHKDGKFTSVPMNYMNIYYKYVLCDCVASSKQD